MKLHQSAQKVVIHEPKIWKIVKFGLMAFEGIFEKVVQKLVALLVGNWTSPRLGYFGQLYVNGLLFFGFGFLLFLEFHW